jgi:hypothetical protein
MPIQYPYEQSFQPQDGMNPNIPVPMENDGSLDFVAGEQAGEDEIFPAGDELPADPFNFYENLADGLKSSKLNSLAISLLSDIKDDRASRKELESTWNRALKYLGFKIEEIMKTPFDGACGAFDTTLATTLMNFLAIAKAELFPPSGPAKSKVEGWITDEMEDRGERVEMFINYFLTVIDRPYYSDSDRLLLYVGLFGSAFRKVVMDPILKRPAPRFIKPQNLIINNHTTSILESTRITEEIFLTRKEVLLRQRAGIYIRDSLPGSADDNDEMDSSTNREVRKREGISESDSENKSLFKFYEMHVELDPKDVDDNFGMPNEFLLEERERTPEEYEEYEDSDESRDEYELAIAEDADFDDLEDEEEYDDEEEENIPRPYIVEICEATKKIVSIRRNWEEQDENFKREECYVHYYYLPGFGIYSIGLAQLQGSNAIVLTDILRQSIDTETRNIFPGGVRQKGMRVESNDLTPGPSTFVEIDTGGAPISDALMFIPSKGMSPGIAQLRTELKTDTMNLGGASQQGHAATSNTPVGTMLAQIEINDRVPSTILISLHCSLAYELQLIKKLFQKYFGDEPYPFNVPGNRKYIMKEDFSDNINIIPVSDPNIITTTQRVVISEIILKMAQANPQMYNLREANERMLRAMKVSDIEKLLPKPQEQQEILPMDPISENMSIMVGKGVKAGIQQDHESHEIVHTPLIQQLTQQAQQDPTAAQKLAVVKAHVAEHQALSYLIKMQQAMGMQMPPEQALQDPQVQNQIAMAAAQATQQIQQQQQAQNPPPLDENKIMMADIEQRREASHLKHDEAQLKAETEAFKAQTQFESNKVKMDVNKELAKDKNEVNLTIAKMKQPHNLE